MAIVPPGLFIPGFQIMAILIGSYVWVENDNNNVRSGAVLRSLIFVLRLRKTPGNLGQSDDCVTSHCLKGSIFPTYEISTTTQSVMEENINRINRGGNHNIKLKSLDY